MTPITAALLTLTAGFAVLLAYKGLKKLMARWVEDVFSNWYEE